jgi:hypothetical protein
MRSSLAPIQPHPFRGKSARTQSRTQGRHPLLGAFPLFVMTLAAILVLFTLAMAQLKAGSDPDLAQSTHSSLVAKAPAKAPAQTP